MAVKCTECGASIQDDSKFCKYCGAKIIQEDLKRVEVKIDNTAEIKRADYEEKESELRQKMMAHELRMKSLKWKVTGILNGIGLLLLAIGFIFGPPILGGLSVLFIVVPYAVMFLQWMNK